MDLQRTVHFRYTAPEDSLQCLPDNLPCDFREAHNLGECFVTPVDFLEQILFTAPTNELQVLSWILLQSARDVPCYDAIYFLNSFELIVSEVPADIVTIICHKSYCTGADHKATSALVLFRSIAVVVVLGVENRRSGYHIGYFRGRLLS